MCALYYYANWVNWGVYAKVFGMFLRETVCVASYILDGCLDKPEPWAAPPLPPLEPTLVPLNHSRISTHLMRGSRDQTLA